MALLLSFLALTSGSACTTVEIVSDVPCPNRPTLTPIPEDLQLRMPPDVVFIVAENQLKLKAYAKKLEVRAGCES
jgi:hypothetical protein